MLVDEGALGRRWLLRSAALLTAAAWASRWPRAARAASVDALPRMALAIGNSRYPFAPLAHPGNDARAMTEQLRRLGFGVELELDATRERMLAAVHEFGRRLAAAPCVGLFYYAGHGAQVDWRNHLIPVDAQIARIEDLPAQSLDLSVLLKALEAARNPMNMVILDACRDNPFGSRVALPQKGLSQFDAPPGSLLAYATSPGHTADDGVGSNGLYTENLLRELGTPATPVEDVFKRVRLQVRLASGGRQVPWESTSLESDFYFMPPRVRVERSEDELEREFEEQLAAWDRIKGQTRLAPLHAFLHEHPSGPFSELAEARLQRLLRRREAPLASQPTAIASITLAPLTTAPSTPITSTPAAPAAPDAASAAEPAPAPATPSQPEAAPVVVASLPSQPGPAPAAAPAPASALGMIEPVPVILVAESIPANPFSRGTSRADPDYRRGDRYAYRRVDALTGLELGHFEQHVSAVREFSVDYNGGRIVRDLLGNFIVTPGGNEVTDQQFFVAEYAIGKRWTTRYRFRKTSGDRYAVVFGLKVVAREAIQVPAGRFDAFKVEGTGYNTTRPGLLRYTYWVAPEQVRLPIVFEVFEDGGTGGGLGGSGGVGGGGGGGGGGSHGRRGGGAGNHGGGPGRGALKTAYRDELVSFTQAG